MSDDDIAQLKRMRDRGEITSAQYETLRRHVLWGTPLPEAVEALGEAEDDPRQSSWQPYVPGGRRAEPVNPWSTPPDDEPTEQYRPPEHFRPAGGQHRATAGQPYEERPAQQPGWPQQPANPQTGHYAGPPSGAVPPVDPRTGQPSPDTRAGHYTGPPSGAVPPVGPQAGHYTGPPSGAVPPVGPQAGHYTDPPSGAVPPVGPQAGHYTGPPSGAFPAVGAQGGGHYTGPPSGAVPPVGPQAGHYTGPPSGAFPAVGPQGGHYTGPPSGAFPAVGAGGHYTGPPSGAFPAVSPQADADRDEPGRARDRRAGKDRAVPELPGKKPARRRRGRGPITFLLSILLAVALAGAGVWWFVLRETGVAPADYARGVCAKVQTWHDDVTARSGQLQQALNSNNGDAEATRSALTTFFDQVAARTHQLRSDVDSVGVPSIDAGQSYVDGLDKKLDDTAAAFSTSADKARALDPADQATFVINVQILQSQVDQQITGVTESLAGTNTPGELRTAYNNASGCAPFTG